MVLSVMLMMARFYSRQRGEKWSDARDRAIAGRSLYIANTTPFGYQRVDKHGQPVAPNARAARLDVHPTEGPIVTELFERRAAGEGWASLRNWLQGTGLKPASQRKQIKDADDPRRKLTVETPRTSTWAVYHVQKLVKRRVYLGQVADAHSGVTADGAHPPLTDPITWQAANDRVGAAFTKTGVGNPDVLLAGVIRCGGCRYKMQPRTFPDTRGRQFYCQRHATHHDCTDPAYMTIASNLHGNTQTRTQGLDEFVIAAMFDYLDRHEMEVTAFGAADGLEALKAEAERAEAELAADATNLDLEALLGTDAWRKRIAERRRVAEGSARPTRRRNGRSPGRFSTGPSGSSARSGPTCRSGTNGRC